MAILHHLCTKCGHPDYFHATSDCSHGFCRCGLASREMDPESVVAPTCAADAARTPILTITPPGTRWPEFGQGHVTCDCETCHARYAELAGGAV